MNELSTEKTLAASAAAVGTLPIGSETVRVLRFGVVEYGEALAFMRECHASVVAGGAQPALIVTEHRPVVTMGNRKLNSDLRFVPGSGAVPFGAPSYFEIDRGGSATAHEPGQMVVYPIFPLRSFASGVRGLVSLLEEAVILTCKQYGVAAGRDPINAGVWCEQRKIAAVGLRVKERVSLHGLAFNVTNSLETFRYIVPCGLQGRGVTSLQRELSGGSSSVLAQAFVPSGVLPVVDLHEVQERFLRVLSDLLPTWSDGTLALDL